MAPSRTVAAADLESADYDGGEVFIDGEVTEIQQMKNPTRFLFICKRGGSQALQIETREVISDTFEVGSSVRLKGRYDRGAKAFTASHIDTKCPSKYEESQTGSQTGSPSPASSP